MKLAFIHVPKTGGSAFVGKIINLWPKSQVSPYTGIQGFMTDPDLTRYHFVAGHTFYPKMKEIMPPGMNYMTILRDPIERVFSHWKHLEKFNLTDVKTFEDFVYTKHKWLASNLMARHISWWPENYHEVPTHSQIIEELDMPLADDELYYRAMSALKEFWYIGLQDRWVEAVKKIFDEFNLPLPEDTVQKGLTNYRSVMSPQMIDDLEEMNSVDIKIYNYYKKIAYG